MMKKNLMRMFVLVCTISLFTACSDDEDNSWKELPQGEVKADKAELSLNGESTTGTINFTALSLSTAQMEIKNVIDGYSDVVVDLQMEKQPDGTFKLNGTKEITTKPVTKAAETAAPFLTVKIAGIITSDGKLTADISATGPGLYIGTYKENNLVLTYGGMVFTNKEVVFDGTDGNNVSLLLKDVIPGERETVLTGIKLEDKGFSGTSTTTYATVKYTGSRADKVLTLNLDVTMNDSKGWARTYGLTELKQGEDSFWMYTRKGLKPNERNVYVLKEKTHTTVVQSAVYTSISHVLPGVNTTRQDTVDACGVTTYKELFRGVLGAIMPQVLQTVSLEKDGNITASYSSDSITFDPLWVLNISATITPELVAGFGVGRTWKQSPKNLAFWYEKEGKLYVKLNVGAILSQATGGSNNELAGLIGTVLDSDAATLKSMLGSLGLDITNVLAKMDDKTFALLLDWVKNGIPVKVAEENGHTHFYLDRESLDPVMKELPALLPALKNMLPESSAGLIGLVEDFVASYKYAEKFEVGLDLMSK